MLYSAQDRKLHGTGAPARLACVYSAVSRENEAYCVGVASVSVTASTFESLSRDYLQRKRPNRINQMDIKVVENS